MRKYFVYLLICLVAFGSCHRPSERKSPSTFKDEVRLKTTPVQDQGKSSLCWVYAMLATIESDRLMLGDSLIMSADYMACMLLTEQVRQRYFSRGRTSISLRGTMPMTLHLMERHGAELFASYHARHDVNYGVLCRKVEKLVEVAVARRLELKHLDGEVSDLLDTSIDFMPKFVFMSGAEYTPMEFAHSVYQIGDYQAFTSFKHHPFGESFVLEVADNQMADVFYNVPIDMLMQRIENSIRAGHPVCWEGDVSEPGFSFRRGVARLDSSQSVALLKMSPAEVQQLRQQQFERFQTTDDHCMALVGIARDTEGRKYFLAKNSWGKKNLYGGFMYLAEDYLKLKTIAVMLRNDEK